MGKGKRGKRREMAVASPSPDTLSARHTFSYGGLLGHDLTASPWLMNVSETTALALDVVQQCVQIIGDSVAGAEVGQWNGPERVEPPSGFTLRPDPDMTRREFLWLFAANLALYQAVYLEEARIGGQVLGVRQHCIANVLKQGDDYYVAGQRIRNPMRLVRRSVYPSLDLQTSATLALAREVFAGAMSANAYQSDFWQQGGAPTVVISTDQELTGDQADAIADRWVDKRTTSPGRPAVIGKGGHADAFGADLGTQGAHVSQDKLRAAMARYFNMPPGFVNVLSEAGPLTYTTTEAEFTRLVRITVQPYCDVIGEALSAYLPGDYLLGDVIVIDPRAMQRADQVSRFTAWNIATGGKPWLLPSEVRLAEGYAPAPKLDIAPEPEVVNARA